MGAVLATVAVPLRQIWFFVSLPLLLALLTAAAKIPPSFVLRRLVLLEPFVAGVAALSLLQPGGWRVALTIVAKSTLCLATVILLTNTTPFAEVQGVLRRLRVSGLLITVLALM